MGKLRRCLGPNCRSQREKEHEEKNGNEEVGASAASVKRSKQRKGLNQKAKKQKKRSGTEDKVADPIKSRSAEDRPPDLGERITASEPRFFVSAEEEERSGSTSEGEVRQGQRQLREKQQRLRERQDRMLEKQTRKRKKQARMREKQARMRARQMRLRERQQGQKRRLREERERSRRKKSGIDRSEDMSKEEEEEESPENAETPGTPEPEEESPNESGSGEASSEELKSESDFMRDHLVREREIERAAASQRARERGKKRANIDWNWPSESGDLSPEEESTERDLKRQRKREKHGLRGRFEGYKHRTRARARAGYGYNSTESDVSEETARRQKRNESSKRRQEKERRTQRLFSARDRRRRRQDRERGEEEETSSGKGNDPGCICSVCYKRIQETGTGGETDPEGDSAYEVQEEYGSEWADAYRQWRRHQSSKTKHRPNTDTNPRNSRARNRRWSKASCRTHGSPRSPPTPGMIRSVKQRAPYGPDNRKRRPGQRRPERRRSRSPLPKPIPRSGPTQHGPTLLSYDKRLHERVVEYAKRHTSGYALDGRIPAGLTNRRRHEAYRRRQAGTWGSPSGWRQGHRQSDRNRRQWRADTGFQPSLAEHEQQVREILAAEEVDPFFSSRESEPDKIAIEPGYRTFDL